MNMKKYLIGLMIMIMSMTSLFAKPLYAAQEKPILKLEDAIQSAIIRSNEMVLNTKEQYKLKEQLKARENEMFLVYQTTYLQKAQNEQQTKMIQDQIARDITNKYNNMLVLEKEIDNLTQNIAIKVKEVKQDEIKNEKGLVNPLTYESNKIELESLKNSKSAKLEELKNAQGYFKIITGKNVTDYTLDDTIHYEIFKIQGSVDGYINSKISEYLKYDKDLARLNQENIITADSAPVVYEEYLEKGYASDAEMISIEEKQKNLRQTLTTTYSSLFSIEEQVSSLTAQIGLTDKKLKVAELRYKAGLISELEYKKQLIAKNEDELKRFNLINEYNSLKEAIQKPWVASTVG